MRREYTIAVEKSNAQYRQALAKKQFIAELLVQSVLETHNESKLRVMQAAHRLYEPALTGANGQTVPGALIPDRHDGVAMLKELLEHLGGLGDSKDVNKHMFYLQMMRANPLPLNLRKSSTRSGVRRRRRSTTSTCRPASRW